MPDSLYPSQLAPDLVNQNNEAMLSQLASIPGLQDHLAKLFQLSQASGKAKDPNYYSSAAYSGGFAPGPMGQDDLTYLSAKIAEQHNPNFNASVGYSNVEKMFPELFSLKPDLYQRQPTQVSWGQQNYIDQLRQQALGNRVPGYGLLDNDRVTPPSRLQ